MDPQDLAPRLEKIETRLAYLEDFLTRLQDEVVGRNATLDRLITENTAMKERLLLISRNLEEMPNQRPPHY
ncbi:SlyX family protein [Treponema primitia]|uniref:SlyX family protein n=1 Tax=Treponema primitia TaxID=88058 RepID=UPI003980CD7C